MRLSIFASLALLIIPTVAQDNTDQVTVYDDDKKYAYYGCYNETTGIEDSAMTRALPDGINETKQGEMTVPLCLDYCGKGDTEYRYAGLEWSRYASFRRA